MIRVTHIYGHPIAKETDAEIRALVSGHPEIVSSEPGAIGVYTTVRVDPGGGAEVVWRDILSRSPEGVLTTAPESRRIQLLPPGALTPVGPIGAHVSAVCPDCRQPAAPESLLGPRAEQLVVTRHPALVDLLIERGLVEPGARVIQHATPEDVRDRHVLGVLPIPLAALARSLIMIPLDIPPELRGVELGIEQLRQYAGVAKRYTVTHWPD